MAGQVPAIDRVTDSFYAWELRGRGWTLAPYPVDLEPPHRPFFVLPDASAVATTAIDDGKRPTLVSSLVDRMARLLAPIRQAVVASEPFEEQDPFPLNQETESSLASFRVSVPEAFHSGPDLAIAIIRSLLRSTHPSAFEVIGHAGSVTMQFTVPEDEAMHVESMLVGFLPDATILRSDDLLAARWDSTQHALVIDLGLANEFFLPIKVERTFDIDPLIPLLGVLAQTRGNEVGVLQVLFQRTVNRWGKTVREALVDDAGDNIFLNAPTFTTLAKEKTASPIVAVVLRVAASARTAERVRELTHGALSYFSQFERGGGNAFIPLANDGYDDAHHTLALLRRESFRTGMLLSVDELAQLVHVPDRSVRNQSLVRQSKRTRMLPSIATGHELVIGANVHRGVEQLATLPDDARLAHMHVIGASGTGKSTLLLSLITQDIANGHGVLVLDPHGDLILDVLAQIPDARAQDVCLFDPADPEYAVGFNVLHAENEVEKNLIASDIVSIFQRLATSWGDAMTTVLGNAVLALLEHPAGGTLVELRRFLVDDAYRRSVLTGIADPHVRFFWEKEYSVIGSRSIGPILTRLDQFLRPKLLRQVVGQRDGKLDLARMVAGRHIVLAKLSQGEIGSANAYLLGSLLIAKLNQVALARQRLSQSTRRPFYCYVDECQHFVSESVATLLTEARKYGVGFTLAHQTLGQLSQSPSVAAALMGSVFTRVVFRVGDDDARKLAEGCSFFDASDLHSLARGEAVVRLGASTNDFNLRVLPRAKVTEGIADEHREQIRDLSRFNYGAVRAELSDLLPEMTEAALSPVVTSGDRATLRTRAALSTTVPSEPVAPRVRSTPKRSASEVPTLGRGGKEHKYLQYLVKRLAEERGWRATIEEPGKQGASIDVVLHRGEESIGVEISITTTADHEIENLKKCAGLGFTRVLFVAKEKSKRERVAEFARKVMGDTQFDAIAPEDIVPTLDALATPLAPTESTVRGYTVRVSRQRLTPEDVAAKRKAVAQVIARSIRPG